MKRIYYYLVLLISIGSCTEPDVKSITTGKEGSPILSFNIELLDSSSFFNTGSIQKGSPTVFFFFSASCPYCRMTTRSIVNNMEEFKNVRFCFISYETMDKLKDYSNRFSMDKYKNIWIGRDTGYTFYKYFRAAKVPYLAVYGSDNTLKLTYKGALSKKQLEEFLKL